VEENTLKCNLIFMKTNIIIRKDYISCQVNHWLPNNNDNSLMRQHAFVNYFDIRNARIDIL